MTGEESNRDEENIESCAGYLSNPPGVLGVETRTLALGPLSGSNLLGIDRT